VTDEVRKRLKAKILYSHIDHKFTVETETDHITGRISPFFSSYNEALMFCGRCDLDLETMTDILEQIKCRHSMATPGPWSAESGLLMSPTTGEILCDGEWYERELGEGFTDNESFVVHSWEDVRWLIEEVERLREP